MPAPDKDLAGSELVGTQTPFQLFAGDADIVTEEAVVTSGVHAKYTVMGKVTATGELVAYDPAANDGSQVAHSILTQAVNAALISQKVAVYTGGYFNHGALVWPAAVNTLAKRKAAFDRTPIHIGSVRL